MRPIDVIHINFFAFVIVRSIFENWTLLLPHDMVYSIWYIQHQYFAFIAIWMRISYLKHHLHLKCFSSVFFCFALVNFQNQNLSFSFVLTCNFWNKFYVKNFSRKVGKHCMKHSSVAMDVTFWNCSSKSIYQFLLLN